mmetsp:Transcript_8661/g.12225  ORF Transcript_8661/g.12225 Transcript_8661/m.12225 type:complete len:178 (-) Transcript_8661:682-1215(-)
MVVVVMVVAMVFAMTTALLFIRVSMAVAGTVTMIVTVTVFMRLFGAAAAAPVVMAAPTRMTMTVCVFVEERQPDQVDQQPRHAHEHQLVPLDIGRTGQPPHRLYKDEECDEQKQDPISVATDDLKAAVAVREMRVPPKLSHVSRKEADYQRHTIHHHVARVGNQAQAVGPEAVKKLQ